MKRNIFSNYMKYDLFIDFHTLGLVEIDYHIRYNYFNPFTPKSDLIDFILSNARRFYSSKGNPLGVKGLKKTISLNPFTPKSDFIDFTLSNARRFYSSKGNPLGVKGLTLDFFLFLLWNLPLLLSILSSIARLRSGWIL